VGWQKVTDLWLQRIRQKSGAVKVNQVVGDIAYPDLSFPRDVCGVGFELLEIRKCADIDTCGRNIGEHFLEFVIAFWGH
jgi:hypothetical protein